MHTTTCTCTCTCTYTGTQPRQQDQRTDSAGAASEADGCGSARETEVHEVTSPPLLLSGVVMGGSTLGLGDGMRLACTTLGLHGSTWSKAWSMYA